MGIKRRLSMLAIFVSLIVSIGLTGCTTNPYTGQQQASKTGIGAGIGAASGAVLGQVIGHNTTATLVGAALGAAVGGVAGNVMDRQADLLRQQLQGTGVSVISNGKNVRLIMPSDITFAVDSSDIKPNFYSVLNSVSLVLKKYQDTMVNVAGFTDNTGSASHNQDLSQQRAQSVASYLTSQGIDSRRFVVRGYGEGRPIAGNGTAAGRAKNRRVEITLQPI